MAPPCTDTPWRLSRTTAAAATAAAAPPAPGCQHMYSIANGGPRESRCSRHRV